MMSVDRYLPRTRIAYFSMEIALRPEIPTYAGGLGILAGDTVRSAADINLPMVFVTLVSRQGYLKQEIGADGRQIDHPEPWNPTAFAKPLGAMVAVEIESRRVWVRPWLYEHASPLGQSAPVLLLDTDIEANRPDDRRITDELYPGDDGLRIRQEIVLGIGGMRVLRALGFEIAKYHLNEGHAALLTLPLLREFPRRRNHIPEALRYDADRVRARCVFTTHTPVEAGHDRFDYGLVAQTLGGYIERDQLKLLAGEDGLNMTRLALNLSGFVNGVALRHSQTTARMFPGYEIHAISNGVHPPTWVHHAFAELFHARVPGWSHEPELLVHADEAGDGEVADAHRLAKADLIAMLKDRCGVAFDGERPIIGFARRMAGYKRPDLLFSDLDRLKAIAARFPFQIVVSGKAHPKDQSGKNIIATLHRHIAALAGAIPMAFVPNYDFALAKTLVAGCDIWLNTPLPPYEASGTSGMKAALNGVINLSVLDGWWVEACREGVTGWSIGTDGGSGADDAAALYAKLDNVVLPLYYQDRARWAWMMKQSISKVGSYFNSHRMMRRYASEAYIG